MLFEGGLTLQLKEARYVGKALWRLIFSGLVIGFGLVTMLGILVAGLSLATSAVIGAILVVTGPTVILPMLRGARIALRPATLLKWEGIVNDPLGALLAIFVISVTRFAKGGEGPGFSALLVGFFGSAAVAVLLGIIVGRLLGKSMTMGWIPEHLKSPVILASVLALFGVAERIHPHHEIGLLAVTVLGIVLANLKNASIEDIRRFKEQISTLLVSLLFLVLSAGLDPRASLQALSGRHLLFVVLVLVAVRPIVAVAATLRSELPWNERAIISWIAPRGVVAAAIAGALQRDLEADGFADAGLIVPITFGVIVSTVVLHGLSIRPLARRLGLASVEGSGVLVVGASEWGVQMCQALAKAGADVVLADTRYRRVSRARMEGLEVHFGDVLSDETDLELPLERLSWILAATDDDAYNSLVCLHFTPEFGRESVMQLSPASRSKESKPHMTGQTPWGEQVTYPEISRKYWKDSSFKVTATSESFSWEDLCAKNPEAFFFYYLDDGKLKILKEGAGAPVGAKVVYLT